MVKDCYIIALPKEKSIHPVLLPLDGPGLDEDRDDLLLALIGKILEIFQIYIKNFREWYGKRFYPTKKLVFQRKLTNLQI